MAQHVYIFCRIPCTHPALVFTESYIQHPVQAVLDPPMGSFALPILLRTHSSAAVYGIRNGPGRFTLLCYGCYTGSYPVQSFPFRMIRLKPVNTLLCILFPYFLPPVFKTYLFMITGFFFKALLFTWEYLLLKIQRDIFHECFLVPFDLQDIIRFLFDDLFCDLLLGSHRIYGHHTTLQAQQFQQLRDGFDLICLIIHPQLPKDKGRFAGPCTYYMHRTVPFCLIPAPPDGFPVNGNNAFCFPRNCPYPPEKGIAELEEQYKATLETLGEQGGILGKIFKGATNKVSNVAILFRIVQMIDKEKWVSMSSDVKGEIYEGLLQKNAEDVKSGAGQYFTPRPLIKAMVRCILERFENFGTSEDKDVYRHCDDGTYSIEHIMPQHLTPIWQKELGNDYEQIHELWLHRMANLTLTAYNSKYSNSSFTEKKTMQNGFDDSGIRMNTCIAKKDKWTLTELEERSEYLMGRALTIWAARPRNINQQKNSSTHISLRTRVSWQDA